MSAWIDQIFGADIASTDGIVRRKIADVQKYASTHELIAEVKSRGFHLIETGDQFVVICNQGEFKIYC